MVEFGRTNKLLNQLFFSLVLSMLTLFATWKIDYLPFNAETRAAVSDVLVFPGTVIARVFYPEGLHTGRGSPGWAYVGTAGNLVFYMIVWFSIIRIVSGVRVMWTKRLTG